MKSLSEYIQESLRISECGAGCGTFRKENEEEEQERLKSIRCGCESEEEEKEKVSGEVSDEKDFREYAENKFQIVFGDKLDRNKMNKTIDGLLKDHSDLVEKGEWGELVGILNKSFGA